jgi:hypothetical protein
MAVVPATAEEAGLPEGDGNLRQSRHHLAEAADAIHEVASRRPEGSQPLEITQRDRFITDCTGPSREFPLPTIDLVKKAQKSAKRASMFWKINHRMITAGAAAGFAICPVVSVCWPKRKRLGDTAEPGVGRVGGAGYAAAVNSIRCQVLAY